MYLSARRQIVLFALGVLSSGCYVSAAPPSWWSLAETRIVAPGVSAENFAPLNLGQLKNMATQAKKHLDLQLELAGGAGETIDALVASFTPEGGHTVESRAANYAPANLGQLKAVAKPFYDRLLSIGFDTRQNLIDHGASGWGFNYAWDPATPVDQNYSPANIGQLKWTFSFDLSIDENEDNIPDWLAGVTDSSSLDSDSDGVVNSQEVIAGTNSLRRDNPLVKLRVFGYTAP